MLGTCLSLLYYNGLLSSFVYGQYIFNWGRCFLRQPSPPLKVMCQQQSSVIGEKKKIPLHSRPPFYLARALKNNHPGHGPLLPIISLIYPHLSLHFPSLLSIVLPSHLSLIVFVFLCASCFALVIFCFLLFLYCFPHLAISSCMSSLSIYFSSTCVFMQSPLLPNVKNAQSHSLKPQPNLHYPAPSFYPLITCSTPLLISVSTPLPTHTNSHTLP